MEQKHIYMDYAATTYVKPEVLAEMTPYFTEYFGNPSSVHSYARETKKAMDHAREQIAEAIGAMPSEIFFTSGATESDNWAIKGMAYAHQKKGKHIFARAIDSVHKAILEAFAIDKVLTPEKDAAREFVQFLALGIHAESFRVDEDYYVIKFKVPRKCAGYPLSGMNLEEDFHLKLIALKQAAEVKNILGMKKLTKEVMTVIPDNYLLKEEDELVCYGLYKDFQALWKAF